MNKYRAAARKANWYNDEAEQDENYNPFRRTRYRPSQPVVALSSATQSDEEISEGEETVNLDLGTIHARHSPVRIPTEDLEARRRREAEEARLCLGKETPAGELRISHTVVGAKSRPRFPGDLRFIFSEVWQNLADIGKSMKSHAHSVPKDVPLVEVPSRPIRFMVVEYAKQEAEIRGTRDQ